MTLSGKPKRSRSEECSQADPLETAFAEVPLDDRPIRFDRMLVRSTVMKEVLRRIIMAGASDVPVLILGETGTGKDLVAQSVHARSARRNGPFVAVNVGAIPRELVASELFGHERGAFTGATGRRKGRFELAEGGTLFLDEITTMDESTQAALLRVLEASEFQRVGGEDSIPSNVRLVAATNADMSRLVAEGQFRADLLYRIDVFSITLPPLRERPSAVPLLAREFLAVYREAFRLPVRGFDPEALTALERYRWPGNVRELKNVVQRAVLLARRGMVLSTHLPDRIVHQAMPAGAFEFPVGRSLRDLEGEYLRTTLALTRGNKARAARLLRISRKSLYQKLRRA